MKKNGVDIEVNYRYDDGIFILTIKINNTANMIRLEKRVNESREKLLDDVCANEGNPNKQVQLIKEWTNKTMRDRVKIARYVRKLISENL